MHDHRTWSLGLGRWGGIEVRLHMFFLLFAAVTMLLCCGDADGKDMAWLAALALLILLVSVVLHEFGHYLVAGRYGGGTSLIILGPVGGLAPMKVPHDRRGQLLSIMAGPLVNLAICLLCLIPLYTIDDFRFEDFVNPLSPSLFGNGVSNSGIRLALWINWVLFLLNLIPAFPFDGGRALSTIVTSLSRSSEHRRTVIIVSAAAKIVAAGLVVAAWFVRGGSWDTGALVPSWFALVLLAIFIYFSARVEETQFEQAEELDEDVFGYDFSQGYTSLERTDEPTTTVPPPRGPVTRWLEARRKERRQRQKATEAEEDRRMDEILARLHESGIDSLSGEDRALLNRVSARYRNRERESRPS